MQNRHSRTHLRALLRGRMREMHREPGPSGYVFRVPCKDYLKGTCTNPFCEKLHPPECLFCKSEKGCRFGEKCSYAHRQVEGQPTKWSKSNNDKSAVALLKKGDWHERESVTDRYHDRSGKPDKRSDKKLERGSSQRQLSDARQLGCVFQDMTPPKSILRKSTDMPKTNHRVKFKKAIARHTKIRDQNPSPMTSSTVSSDSVTRARGDLCGIDSYPVTVSSKHVERKERGDLLTKPTKNPKPKKKRRPRFRTERPVKFRHTGMAARIQRKSRG